LFAYPSHEPIRDKHQGVDVELLEKKLESGQVPKMMYVVTTCHNPTGRTLIAERRAKLAELSNTYGFYLVCDEVYQMLAFPGVEVPPPMFTYDKHGTILGLGSFSKVGSYGFEISDVNKASLSTCIYAHISV
jgi:2-aminoadipate transaminase